MIGVGIGRMAVVVVVRMAVIMRMVMAVPVIVFVVVVPHRDGNAIGLAGAGALVLTQGAGLHQTLHVMVVALLGCPHLRFKPQHLGAVLAQGAVHLRLTPHHLLHPLQEGVDHQGVVPQVGGLEKLHLGVVGRHQLGVLTDAAHQHPGEQEIGEHHDALEAQAHHMAQPRLHQREGHPRIHGFAPAETEALHQHPRHLGHIGVGIRVGGAAPHHHQQGVAQGYSGGSPIQRRLDAGAGGQDHAAVDPQLAAVINAQPRLSRIGVEHRGDVVLGVAGGEQHARHRQHPFHPLLPQALQAVAQDRARKFQIAVFHWQLRQALPQALRQLGEFPHRLAIAAAMATDQHPHGSAVHGLQHTSVAEIGLLRERHGKVHLARP